MHCWNVPIWNLDRNNNLLTWPARVSVKRSKIVQICLSFRLHTDVIFIQIYRQECPLTAISPIWVLDKQTLIQQRARESERERWQPSLVQSGAPLAGARCATRLSTPTSKCSARIENLSTGPVYGVAPRVAGIERFPHKH